MSTTLSLIVGSCVTSQGAGGTENFAGIIWFSGGERRGDQSSPIEYRMRTRQN